MPYGIDDADWPWFKRMLKDYKAGRFTKKPKTEGRPKFGGRGLKLARTVDAIEQGKTGKIVRLQRVEQFLLRFEIAEAVEGVEGWLDGFAG